MRRTLLIPICALGLSGLAGGVAVMHEPWAEPAQATRTTTSDRQQTDVGNAGVWQPPSGLKQIPIWPNGAPDMEGVSQPAERVEVTKAPDVVAGRPWTAAYDVTSPTMTVFPPVGMNTGASIVVFPGGGFRLLAMDLEGTEICDWMTAKGITCVLLKYRVPKSNHYWDKDCHCHITPKVPRALQDAQRTIRLVRARAKELNIDPNKIGVIGFSAGGYLVAQTSNIFEPTYKPVDAADKLSSRPDFAVALYPGHRAAMVPPSTPAYTSQSRRRRRSCCRRGMTPRTKSATARFTRAPLMMRASRQRSISLPRAGTPSD